MVEISVVVLLKSRISIVVDDDLMSKSGIDVVVIGTICVIEEGEVEKPIDVSVIVSSFFNVVIIVVKSSEEVVKENGSVVNSIFFKVVVLILSIIV